ncbi:hypothetical protein [Brevundimonas lenta]|uniref:Secreted protein n=1 Tax=Brevundimonas lenta TaxID=424796 RepID=A0A7W6NRA9_9CAUL|nr:hypothetical protein [Brevundimonas lenta]MBB4084062.1 hypothetical protein [Brevundimonas lenta]
MINVRKICLAVAAAALTTAAVGPAEALVRQSWDPSMVAYSYVYYADAAKTIELGYAEDQCVASGSSVYVSSPYIPTAYYDRTPMYVCSGMGPYLPPDWG